MQQMSSITLVMLQVPAHLHLVCRKCTREAGFAGTQEEAEALARRAGWVIGERVICPKCCGSGSHAAWLDRNANRHGSQPG